VLSILPLSLALQNMPALAGMPLIAHAYRCATMLSAGYPTGPHFSPLIFLCLLTALGASVAMYWLLVRRSTARRQWVSLADWGRDAGFRIGRRHEDALLPPPLDVLGSSRIAVRIELTGERMTSIVQAQPADADNASPGQHPPAIQLLIRKIEASWPPTGLRPVQTKEAQSLIDLYNLCSFPLMGAGQRFIVHGIDSAPARILAQSSIRALLPQDVGLLLHGHYLVLDFSSRPFDGIEFSRMIAVVEQVVAHLPGVKAG
jgi:hypothetical protein